MSLQSRISDFDIITNRFACQRPGKLVCAHQPTPDLWERLRVAAALYLSKCLPGNRVILDDAELIRAFETERSNIRNITPNGMIVPKRHTILEYNALARAFADIISALNIRDMIHSWHPINLRIKYAELDPANLERPLASERIHSDSWAGDSSESANVFVPLFGDTDRNCVTLYDPPYEFEESWLNCLPRYTDGQAIAEQYTKLDFVIGKGQIGIVDFATLHASTRLPGAGTRISLDTSFHVNRARGGGDFGLIHADRLEEYLAPEVLAGLGETHLFLFPDTVDQRRPNTSGYRHPANLHVVELLK